MITNRIVTMQGKELTLGGRKINKNSVAPYFRVVDHELNEVTLNHFANKIKIFTTFVSLDTSVCNLQVKEFNKRAVNFSPEVVVIAISKDLPFAEKRFCQDNSIKNIQVLSDYKTSSFGINYGLLIKELNLLARSVFIVDKSDIVRYVQIVPEITDAPNYEEVLKQLEKIVQSPVTKINQELAMKCTPCKIGTPPLAPEEIKKRIKLIQNWELVENKKLVKEFTFKSFMDAKYFLDVLALLAEEQGHHPNFTLIYNKLKVTLTTHASGGLTPNDFIMAKMIDEMG